MGSGSGSVQVLHRVTRLYGRRHTGRCPHTSTMCCRASLQL